MFFLASMGTTLGLGNIWRFPYIAGENGGGAFILIYLACLVCFALPAVIAELTIGKTGRAGAALAFSRCAQFAGSPRGWSWLGHAMVFASLLVLFYYPVIGSWSLEYAAEALAGKFASDGEESARQFQAFMSDSLAMATWYTVFHFAAVFVVFRGLAGGIEVAIRVAMPALFVILAGLLLYVMLTTGLSRGIWFMFKPDFSEITPDLVVAACGQALFSTAVAQAALLAYAAYVDEAASMARYGLFIVLADTVTAILAGILVFSIVFGFGLQPDAGTGLVFQSLPLAFAVMPFGNFIGAAFFILLTLAAFTSVIPTLEVITRWMEDHLRLGRRRAVVILGTFSWMCGLAVVWSLDPGKHGSIARWSSALTGGGLLLFFDRIASELVIPISALLLAVFVGWVLPRDFVLERVPFSRGILFASWRTSLRFLTPLGILAILISSFVE